MPKAYSYIRMSTPGQLKGDSLRRQIAKSQAYAAKHGLVLDQTLRLQDIGQSAFDGSNLSRGDLGEFLRAVREGRVEKGSILLVESLDRLSRQGALESVGLFMQLLSFGITVVTLFDERVFSPEKTDFHDLSLSLGVLQRAHEESQTKSKRLSEAWSQKRERIGAEILTKRAVAWVRALDDRSRFELIEDRSAVVRRIFEEAVNMGMGADVIARRLNREAVPTFGRSNGWHKSYILKILHNSACIGEFQARTRDGKPAGEPRQGYYPPVVDEATFAKAQAILQSRKTGSAGRKGNGLTNLFMGLLRCGVCGGPMHLINKGAKGGIMLVCDAARRNVGCHKITWAYRDFEASVLTYLEEVDLATLASGDANKVPSADRSDLAVAVDRVAVLKARRDKTFNLILGEEATTFLADKLRELDELVAFAEKNLEIAQTQSRDSARAALATTGWKPLRDYVTELQTTGTFEKRAALASRIRLIVGKILLWPGGRPVSQEARTALHEMYLDRQASDIDSVLQLEFEKKNRAFFIEFRDGSHRLVSPSDDNPMVAKNIVEPFARSKLCDPQMEVA